MKLKERIALVSFGSCFILLFFKYTSTKLGYHIIDDVATKNHEKKQFLSNSAKFDKKEFVKEVRKRDLLKPLGGIKSLSNGKHVERDNNLFEEIHPWDIWWSMVGERYVTKPQAEDEVKKILKALATAPIIEADVGVRGTQLKASLKLDGPEMQKVVFKPMRYSRQHIISGHIYDGFDRHNGEIAAFHLDRILEFYRAPPVIGRKIDLEKDLKPVARKQLLKTFFTNEKQEICFYGVCNYCKKSEAACADGNIMEGSITIWLPAGWELANSRHPWQRTYRKNKKARWELDPKYCLDIMKVPPYDSGPRLLDIMDTAIFDFLIGNGDRHHYETFKKGGSRGMLLHLDNAKSFGNHLQDEMSILAPIVQCCRIRKSTYERLRKIPMDSSLPESLSSRLRESLLSDPLSPVLDELHLLALDRRLRIALDAVENCIKELGTNNVVIVDEF